jgi:hypothetical protein
MRLALLLMLSTTSLARAWEVRGPEGVPSKQTIEASSDFAEAPLPPATKLGTPPADLARVAGSALAYIDAMTGQDPAVGVGMLGDLGIDGDRLRRTLEVIVQVAEEDRLSPEPRLSDPAWIEAHFTSWRWRATPAQKAASSSGQLRLTRYLVTRLEGRDAPDARFNQALYADPGAADRTRFSRAEIVAGAWAAGGATPLVWLTEEGVYDALLQGTVEVEVPGRAPRLFNVHQHNGIPYDRSVRDPRLQRRYWYFRQVDQIRGWGQGDHYIALQPGAAVAGDIFNLGVGLLLAIDAPSTRRLAILADTGGAFQPNLHQLDWLAGTYSSHAALYKDTAWLPSHADVHLLLWREPWER